MMTEAEVKRDLPPVKIEWEGRTYWGRVTGRLNQWASVSPSQPIDNRKHPRVIMGPIFQYAWSVVTNAVNSGKPLKA